MPPEETHPNAQAFEPSPSDGGDDKRPQRELLIECAQDAELWHDPDRNGYATVPVGDHHEHYRIRSRMFRDWMARHFYERYSKPPGGQAAGDAVEMLDAKARFEGEEHHPAVRIAEHAGAIYLDLGRFGWDAIEVDVNGWRIVSDPPIKFIRPRGIRPLPLPHPGGDIETLRSIANVGSNADYRLIAAWLLAALRPTGPFPILVLNGEQGSAKSTTARVLRALIDPNAASIRTAPRSEHDLLIAARNGWVVALDNLSYVPPWLADSLCRLATGGGFGTRELFTDSDEILFEAQRPIILNGIPDLATRPDLAGRAIVLNLPQIPDHERRPETAFWQEFERLAPLLLGALLDAVSGALKQHAHVSLPSLPRMADFALWATAAEGALGWSPGTFMDVYAGNQAATIELTLESDPVATAVRDFATESEWQGTASKQLAELSQSVTDDVKNQKSWPKDGSRLSGQLKRAPPGLRAVGVDIQYLPGRHYGRIISIRTVPQNAVLSVPAVLDSAKPLRNGDKSQDGTEDGEDGGNNAAVLAKSLKNNGEDGQDGQDGVLRDCSPSDSNPGNGPVGPMAQNESPAVWDAKV